MEWKGSHFILFWETAYFQILESVFLCGELYLYFCVSTTSTCHSVNEDKWTDRQRYITTSLGRLQSTLLFLCTPIQCECFVVNSENLNCVFWKPVFRNFQRASTKYNVPHCQLDADWDDSLLMPRIILRKNLPKLVHQVLHASLELSWIQTGVIHNVVIHNTRRELMKWPVTSMLFCNLTPCDDCTLYDERLVLLAKQTIHFVNTYNVVLVGLGIGVFELDKEHMLDSELDIEDMLILVWMPLVSDLQKLASLWNSRWVSWMGSTH